MVSRLPKWVWAGGAALAFSAGMVNVIALLGFSHHAATHMTGVFSSLSIASVQGDRGPVFDAVFILLSFFIGAFVSGVIIRDGHLRIGRRYGLALTVEFVLLACATFGFVRESIWGEYFACAAAGLQNAMASTYSGTIIRTTHLTGVLTDLGAIVGSGVHGHRIDLKRVQLLLIIVISFVAGGCVGTLLYDRLGAWAMIGPTAVIGVSALTYILFIKKLAALDSPQRIVSG